MGSIKIDPRFKGEWHYEVYLLAKLRKEITQYAFEMNYPKELRKLIRQLYDQKIDKENILLVYTHPPNKIIYHLCYGGLGTLYRYTSSHTLKK